MLLYAVIIGFAFGSFQGEAVADGRFATMAQCEAAQDTEIAAFVDKIKVHGPEVEIMSSHCGFADELEGQDI